MGNSLAPVLFLSHGGGPLPLLGDPGHQQMVQAYGEIRQALAEIGHRPEAILVVSAHWETPGLAVTAQAEPPLIYDYFGFPEESYQIRYPAPGHPALARQMVDLLESHEIPCEANLNRGLDHGVFVPLTLLFPEADIPVVQLSLSDSLDPRQHFQIGKALQPLRQQNILVVGSGFSFHNLRTFFAAKTQATGESVEQFNAWLDATVAQIVPADERERQLADWEQAPSARFCHPREEHLLPLHVVCGVADNAADKVWKFPVMGIDSRCYGWGF